MKNVIVIPKKCDISFLDDLMLINVKDNGQWTAKLNSLVMLKEM